MKFLADVRRMLMANLQGDRATYLPVLFYNIETHFEPSAFSNAANLARSCSISAAIA